MRTVISLRPGGLGVFTFLIAFALAGCSEARTAGQPPAPLSGPNAYLSARALDNIVFQPGTVADIRPTGKVVEVRLEAATSRWELAPGKVTEAVTYNGTVPGPTIRATEGDTLRVTLTNKLRQDTSIHWHGLHIKNDMDGVPPYTQAPIRPGATFVYEFTVSHAGTFMYHPHVNAVAQIDNGLYGVLIVDPQQPDAPKPAKEFTMMLGAWNLPSSGGMAQQAPGETRGSGMPDMGGMMPGMGAMPGMGGGSGSGMMMNYNWFTINGKAFPATGEWVVSENDIVRVRLINVSNLAPPRHLHGQDFKVIAKDGEPLAAGLQTVMNTLALNSGETYDILLLANNPGVWVFHCHELHHTENDGVEPGGLMQVIRYQNAKTAPAAQPAATPRPQQPGMPGMSH